MTGTMRPGDWLSPGESLVSDNGNYELTLQKDGNLCIYYVGGGAHNAIWCTMTQGKDSQKFELNASSGLQILDGQGKVIWTGGAFGAGVEPVLAMQNDGNLVIYAMPAVWATHTNGQT